MNEPQGKRSSASTVLRIVGVLAAVAVLCCGGSALVVRVAMPNVWKLMTMSAEDFAPADAGTPP